MRLILIASILLILAVTGLTAKKLPPLTTVSQVDLNRYLGTWYQIAYFPTSFQPNNAALVTAEYSLSPKGYIVVKNTSYNDFEGKSVKKDITGKAFITDKKTNAKLKVQFFWPFKGAYWITLLDQENYDWVVVSHPKRNYLWILARSPYMDKGLYQSLLKQIQAKHIDLDRLVLTGKLK